MSTILPNPIPDGFIPPDRPEDARRISIGAEVNAGKPWTASGPFTAAPPQALPVEDHAVLVANPGKTMAEVVEILLKDSTNLLVEAGQYCRKIDDMAAEATKMSTAAEVFHEQAEQMRREFAEMVKQGEKLRDQAIRLARRDR